EEALEVAARQYLALDALRELAVLDRHGGDAGKGDAELEVLVDQPVGRRHVVDVENAEGAVFAADERAADRRANLLHEDRLAAEPRVFAGIVGENRNFVLERFAGDRLRHGTGRVAAALVARDLRHEVAIVVDQQNRDAIHLENLVRVSGDLVEQRIDVRRFAESLRDLEQRRELLPALLEGGEILRRVRQRRHAERALDARERRSRVAHRQLANDRRARRRTVRFAAAARRVGGARWTGRNLHDAEADLSERDDVAGFEHPSLDARAIEKRAVARAQIAHGNAGVARFDFGVASRDRGIDDR